ncbi:hypothetical protein CR513_57458, partial [Mucuna pruriens]
MRLAEELGAKVLTAKSDSQLVTDKVNGDYQRAEQASRPTANLPTIEGLIGRSSRRHSTCQPLREWKFVVQPIPLHGWS